MQTRWKIFQADLCDELGELCDLGDLTNKVETFAARFDNRAHYDLKWHFTNSTAIAVFEYRGEVLRPEE